MPGGTVRDAAEVVVRTTTAEAQATEWVAVLGAAGIPARVQEDDGEWTVLVAEADASAATDALEGYDAEEVTIEGAPLSEWGPTPAGLIAAACLLVFTPFIGFRTGAGRLFLAGEGKASAI